MLEELPLVTCGADLSSVSLLTSEEKLSYTASEVLEFMLARQVG